MTKTISMPDEIARMLAMLVKSASDELEQSEIMGFGDFWDSPKIQKLTQLIRAYSAMEKIHQGESGIEGRIDESYDAILLARYLSIRLEEAGNFVAAESLRGALHGLCPHCQKPLMAG